MTENLPLIYTTILCEFDIDKGASVTCQYPFELKAPKLLISDQCLPDGCHEVQEDCTFFILNRKQFPSPLSKSFLGSSILPNFFSSNSSFISDFPSGSIPATLYKYQFGISPNNWKLYTDQGIGNCNCKNISISISKNNGQESLLFSNKSIIFFSLPIKSDLLVSYYDPSFVLLSCRSSFLSDQFLAIRFDTSASQRDFLTVILNLINSLNETSTPPVLTPHPDKDPCGPTLLGTPSDPLLYCFSVVWSKRLANVPRGSVVKAICICSPFNIVTLLKPVMLRTLELIFENLENSVEIFKGLFDNLVKNGMASFNEIPRKLSPNFGSNFYDFEHSISKYGFENFCSKFSFRNFLHRNMGVSDKKSIIFDYNGSKIEINFDLIKYPDEIFSVNLASIILIFKENIMTLFNAILFNQTVVIVAPNQTASFCSYLALSLVMLVIPLRGLISTRLFPFSTLINQSYLTVPGSITCTNNPMFQSNNSWFDVCGDVSTGQISFGNHSPIKNIDLSQRQSFFEEDQSFIQSIISALLSGQKSNDWIIQSFSTFTSRLLNFCLYKPVALDDNLGFSRNESRVEAIKSSELFFIYQLDQNYFDCFKKSQVDFYQIITEWRGFIKGNKNQERDVVSELISTLDDVISRDDDVILEFLSVFPLVKGGITSLSTALFHKSENIRRKIFNILTKISQQDYGKQFIDQLNFMARIALKNENQSNLIDI
ncbi:hypothetical protein RCL1_006044 [Eukaryota sp. TZLM3-RCL]